MNAEMEPTSKGDTPGKERAVCPFGATPAETAARAAAGIHHERTRPIPAAPGLPLFGNMAELLIDPLAFFLKSYMTLGPVFRVKAPTRSYVVMAGMEAIRFLLREDAHVFTHVPLYENVARELDASHYPISTTGDRHRHLRRALKPAFGIDALAGASPAILDAIRRRATQWTPGARFVLLDLIHDLLGNIVVPALGGQALGDRLGDAVRFARFSVGSGLGAYPVAFRHAPHYRLSRRRMMAYYRDLLAWHRKSPPGRDRDPDFFDHVLAMDDEHGDPLSEENAVAVAQMVYSNTLLYVAPAVAFMLHCLLSEPDVLARCLQEIDDAFSGGTPDIDRLQACTYLDAAKTESMRKHPIGLAAPRIVKKAFRFEGCELREGEAVLVAVSVAHYLPEIYPEPHRFDPARHLAPRSESRVPGAFSPLGIGAHSCLGARLVDAMVLLVVGALLRGVRLELERPGAALRKRVNPFPEPTSDLVVRVLGPRDAAFSS